MNLIKHFVRINSTESTKRYRNGCHTNTSPKTISGAQPTCQVTVDGRRTVLSDKAETILDQVYKTYVGDYPKFHKMDPLCRVGFVASELLLTAEGRRDEQWGETRAIVLVNAASSLADDRKYQSTIDDPETAYPSPSLFVYTLPNVLTGEIAIRNHCYGETNFIVLPEFDCDTIANAIETTFADQTTETLLTGWVDCYSETDFDVLMFIVERDAVKNVAELSNEIQRLRDFIAE